jgi:hypothetical protein
MNVRDYFNSQRADKTQNITQIRKLMDAQPFVRLPVPQNIKIGPLVAWCQENIGRENFVICQNTIYFEDTASAVQFKLLFNEHSIKNTKKKRWY